MISAAFLSLLLACTAGARPTLPAAAGQGSRRSLRQTGPDPARYGGATDGPRIPRTAGGGGASIPGPDLAAIRAAAAQYSGTPGGPQIHAAGDPRNRPGNNIPVPIPGATRDLCGQVWPGSLKPFTPLGPMITSQQGSFGVLVQCSNAQINCLGMPFCPPGVPFSPVQRSPPSSPLPLPQPSPLPSSPQYSPQSSPVEEIAEAVIEESPSMITLVSDDALILAAAAAPPPAADVQP